jgi:hypothetical protein
MLVSSVKSAVEAGGIDLRDQAAVDLALTYAAAIDDVGGECPDCGRHGADLAKLGPALLAALEALHMSPRARAAVKKAVTDDKPAANPLDQLADRRAGRGRPQAVDTAPA